MSGRCWNRICHLWVAGAAGGTTTAPWSTGYCSGSEPVSRGVICRNATARGRPSTNGIAAGRRRHLGPDTAFGPGRRRPGGAGRLVDGRGGLDVLPGPSARGRRPQGQAAGPEKRTTPRHHRPDEGLGRSRGRSDLQDPPRRRRRLSSHVPPAHAGTVGRRTADDRGPGPDPSSAATGRKAPDPAGPRQRRQGIQLPPKPALPAKTQHPAHDPGTEGPAGQPPPQGQQRGQARHLRPRPLSATQRGRADHQPAQELPRGRDALRHKRAYVFHGTVTAAAIRLWLRQ